MSNAVLYGRGNLLRAVTYYLQRNLLRALQRVQRYKKATHVRRYIFSANNLYAPRARETLFKRFFRHVHVPHLRVLLRTFPFLGPSPE